MQDQRSSTSIPDDSALAENLRKRMERAGRQVLGDQTGVEEGGHRFMFRTGHERQTSHQPHVEAHAQEPVLLYDNIGLREVPDSEPLLDVGGYQSPMMLAQMLVVMLALQAGYFIFSLLARFSVVSAGLVSPTQWGPVELFLFTLTAGAFVAWTYRLYRNLGHLGAAGLSTSAATAAALAAAPVVNLVAPPIILHEIWGATDPHVDCRVNGWRRTDFDAIIPVWWATFVAAISLRLATNLDVALADNVAINVAAGVAFTLAAILGIASVWRISVRQDDKQLLVRAGLEEV